MKLKIYPVNKPLKGAVRIPGDKSISHRSIIISSISNGVIKIYNILESDDVKKTIQVFKSCGVNIKKDGNKMIVYGKGLHSLKNSKKKLYLGNSGTSARLIMGILSFQNFSYTLLGDKSLSSRPMGRIINPLKKMGAKIKSKNNRLPVKIFGKQSLIPIKYTLPIPSAQVKSGILLAGLSVSGRTVIKEKIPSRDHTEIMLKKFGAKINIIKKNKTKLISLRGGFELIPKNITVPGDFSSAAFLIVAALIIKDSFLKLKNININPMRTGLLKALRLMGGKIRVKNMRIISGEKIADIEVKYSKLNGCKLHSKNAPLMIDEYPILAIAASQADSKSKFYGLKELTVKESNRLLEISNNLKKFGIINDIKNNNLTITPTKNTKASIVKINSKGDHRMAMAFAVMGMVSSMGAEISEAEYINTSFPNFKKIFNSLGAKIV